MSDANVDGPNGLKLSASLGASDSCNHGFRRRRLREYGIVGVTATLLAALALSLWFAYRSWQLLADVQISSYVVAAIVLGVLLTTALASGLIGLMIFSHHKGYDDEAARLSGAGRIEKPLV
jgi:hypothetical protein